MKKLAFGYAGAGSFEMPKLQPVNLEKDSHIAFARKVPTSVYQGGTTGFTIKDMLKAATDTEIKLMEVTASTGTAGA